MRVIRRQRDEESAKERAAVKEVLGIWTRLREARRKQGYHSTALKLTIHKEAADINEDREKWEREIARELEEAREDFEASCEELSQSYERRLKAWKETHGMQVALSGSEKHLRMYEFQRRERQPDFG